MPVKRDVVIIGAGGFGREVAWLLEGQTARNEISLVGFAEQAESQLLGQVLNGLACRELEHFIASYDDLHAVIGIGSSGARERIFAELTELGIGHHACVDDGARLSKSVRIGAGTVICCGSVLTVNIDIGRSVHINLDCTVGHDAVIEDFVTIAPGAHISGNVIIRKGAYVGTGANVINGNPDKKLEIGEAAVVGAGACVIRDVPAGETVVGVPARPKS